MSRVRGRVVGVALALVALCGGLGVVGGASAQAAPVRPSAEPTLGVLISGTVSQVAGTHVWTDYAYDDRGADATKAGVYPPAAGATNAADLIQLQLSPGTTTLGIRAVLETLVDARVPAIGVGLDLDGSSRTGSVGVPGDRLPVAGERLGLERFVVVSSDGARVLGWSSTGWRLVSEHAAAVDPVANTVAAQVPMSAIGPHGPTWKVLGLAGLALPGASWVDGSGPIYDLAYVVDGATTNFQSNGQAAVLSGVVPARAAMASVELASVRTKDVLPTPQPGVKSTFLYRSQLDLGEGTSGNTFGIPNDIAPLNNDVYRGPYQPYAVWFPPGLPDRPPLVVFLHGSLGDHLGGAYGGGSSRTAAAGLEIGDLDLDAVHVTPLGRGPTPIGGYEGPAEQDVLDVIADVSRRFRVDEDRVVLTGYSLGGVGTFRLAQLYPDRWAGAVEIVGADDLGVVSLLDEVQGVQRLPNQLENLRNLRFRMAHARLDELELLIGGVQPDRAFLELQGLGYDVRYWQFLRREHLAFPVPVVQCELEAAIARGRVRDPARVTFSQEPAVLAKDARTGLDLDHDSAYWMSDMVVRGTTFRVGDEGTVDVTSLARPDRAPVARPILGVHENLTAGRDVCGPNPDVQTADVWYELGQELVPGPARPTSNGFRADLERVASVVLDLGRMSIDSDEPVGAEVRSDGGSRIRLRGSWDGAVTIDYGRGTAPQVRCPRAGTVDLVVGAGRTTATVTPTPGAKRCW